MFGRQGKVSGETCLACASRTGVRALIVPLRPDGPREDGTGKTRFREGGQEGGCAMPETEQQNAGSADEATQGGEAARDFSWVEASVWTKRMLSALVNGVKGGKWYALMDKMFAPDTLKAAWTKVEGNKGAAGVDGQSIGRFAARADAYLAGLSAALWEGSYRPQAVKRVEIP